MGRGSRSAGTGALLVLGLVLVASPAVAERERRSLPSIMDTARAGAPGLALELLSSHQPPAARAPTSWADWERARIELLANERAWSRALGRLTDLPSAAPADFRRWALERRAVFHLRLDDPGQALTALRRLLWQVGRDARTSDRRRWRRLVVRAHLSAGATDDAVTALRRFDQDFASDEPDWQALRARVLLRAERPGEVLDVLAADSDDHLLHALRLLAELRAGAAAPASIVATATERAADEDLAPGARARFHAVAADAADRAEMPGQRALSVERAFAGAAALPPDDALFRVTADRVWAAWLAWGQRVGNDDGLLIGDDGRWLAGAAEASEDYPVRARSLLAVVALRGGDARAAAEAHGRLIEALVGGDGGRAFARRVYLEAGRFDGIDGLPATVRYWLLDDALAREALELAMKLMRGLDAPPEGREPFDWQLLRARVLILGGRPREGADEAGELLATHGQLGGERLDRVLQVLFDLQGAGEHERALALFVRLGEQEMGGQRRRELLYWRAESHQALDDHRRAAELYMRSATLLDGRGGDRWGQTARYQAAGQLAELGLVNDARRIYRVLLRATEDPGRRAQLRNRLQRLGLRDPGTGDLPLPAPQ